MRRSFSLTNISSFDNRAYQLHNIKKPKTVENNYVSQANEQVSTIVATSASDESPTEPPIAMDTQVKQRGSKRIAAMAEDNEKLGHLDPLKWEPVAVVVNRTFSILHLVALLVCFFVFVFPILINSN